MISWKMVKGMTGVGLKVFSQADAEKLGADIVAEMKDLISKGISPIKQIGRFPGYLAAEQVKALKKAGGNQAEINRIRGVKNETFNANKEIRALTSTVREYLKKGKDASHIVRRINEIRKGQVTGSQSGAGYPYSVQGKYPGKQDRPVNLFLSGDQMSDLKFTPVDRGDGAYTVNIGYEPGTLSALKEQGHREGVHGQPSRPTIPSTGEDFAASINTIIRTAVNDSVRAIMESKKS